MGYVFTEARVFRLISKERQSISNSQPIKPVQLVKTHAALSDSSDSELRGISKRRPPITSGPLIKVILME
jgi:hypothetical protein